MKPNQVVSPRSVLPFPIHTTTTTTHVLIRTYVEVRQSQLSTTVKTFFFLIMILLFLYPSSTALYSALVA